MATSVRRGRRVRRTRRRRGWPLLVVIVGIVLAAALFALGHRGSKSPQVDRANALCVVCIDPGHGGDDQGTAWEGRLEKEDNLKAALALRDALAERNIYSLLTREGDTGLTLEERVLFAQEQQADFYISLHRNAAEVAANGIEVWVAENCSATSLELAQRVEQGLLAAGVQNSRGVRYGSQSGSGDYYVLSHTTMPAILVELGFIQDQEDNRLLDRNLKQYAEAIADAVAGLVEGEQSS